MFFWLSITFLASQVFAGIAIISDIFSFQFKERKKIIIFFIISAICIALHYFLLERYVGAFLITLWVIRFFVAYHKTQRYWIYIFIFLFGCTTVFFYKDVYDIVIFAATTFITVGVFQKDDRHLRLLLMCGTSLVVLYNFLIFSPVGVLLESIFLISNFVWYYRHYLRKDTKLWNTLHTNL